MNILLFGGSFNPPHLGHQIVIEQAFELVPDIDELWLVPCYGHTFGKELTPAVDRLAMCELLISNQLKTKVCPIEIDHHTSGSTYETLKLLQSDYPHYTFSFLMGSDQLPVFTKWTNWQQLLQEMHFYIYPRGSHRHPIEFNHMSLLESPTQVITNISSTLIKDRLRHHLPIDYIIPKNVLDYIDNHHLYL